MVSVSPKPLPGKWTAGYALDLHTLSSDFLGHDEWGNARFDSTRSEMGELLYRLKYHSDKTVIRIITETVVDFVRAQAWEIDLVIPVPPSRQRAFQPVLVLAEAIAGELGVVFCGDCVVKVRDTPELKGVFDLSKRQTLLRNAYAVSKKALSGKRVLLFDDLYRSGATINTISTALAQDGGIISLYVLTLTMTRTMQ